MPEKSNASRCVPSSFKIEAAQVVAARRRAGGAWKPAVVPHEIKSRAALALCMVYSRRVLGFATSVAGGEDALQTQRVRGSGPLASGLAPELVVSAEGFTLISRVSRLGSASRREHERYDSTRLLPVFRYLWTCESPAPRRRVVAARPLVTVLPGSTSTRWRVHASVRSSEGPQTVIAIFFGLAAVRH